MGYSMSWRRVDALQVVGPFRGTSGYDRHTRSFVRQFVQLGVRVHLTPLVGWSPDVPEARRDEPCEGLDQPVDADTTLHFVTPSHLQPHRHRRNVNYTMFEADRIPPDWAAAARFCDLVVVPTRGAYDAWTASSVPARRVRVAPLGVDADRFTQTVAPLDLTAPGGRPLDDFAVRFLNVAELRPRKNHLGLLRAWTRATRATDDAVLVLKVSAFQPHELAAFTADVQRLVGGLAGAAPVVLLTELLSDDALRRLYAAATHYISLSHGEGWDLVAMEAAVSGLPLIVPRHSAYAENLREQEVTFIAARPAPAQVEGVMGAADQTLFDGLFWWDPDEEEAAAIIRAAIDGHEPPVSPPGPRLAAEFDWGRSTRRLLDVLEET